MPLILLQSGSNNPISVTHEQVMDIYNSLIKKDPIFRRRSIAKGKCNRMIKTLKVRFYPDKEQIILPEKHPGSCRFVYNHFYEVRIKYQAEHRKYWKNRLTGFDTMWMLILSANLICCKSVETVKFSPGFVNINGLYSQICVILYIYCTITGLIL